MVSGKSFVGVLVCALCVSHIESVRAESSSLHLVHRLSLPSPPVKGVIAVSNSEKVLTIVPAAVIAHESGEVTIVGEATISSTVGPLSALFTVYGKTGELMAERVDIPPLSQNHELLMDVAHLRNWTADQKKELKKLEAEEQAQRAQLQQLQKKRPGRGEVAQGEAEVAQGSTHDDLEGMSSSVKFAQERLTAVRSGNLPLNYKRREAELSAYLNVLSTELKLAKDGGGDLLSDASKEMLAKRTLIEATKDEHIDLLQEELAEVRKQREAAERQ